ncbi:toll-like receptor 4 [Saccostrea echinata]|uniref:toll-like receptor 4 n=1 Tax=Saccostrea echinata TaxID=191078 RepID=UPI002A82251B|nr:toll-like receptor 4 [Saccostrea echinata]
MGENTFQNISNLYLKKLVLRNNHIRQVYKPTFQALPRLQYVDLSGNVIHTKYLKKALFGFRNSTLQELYLTKLHISNLADDFFLHLTTIQRIFLDDNVLFNFSGNLFSLPQQIQLISLKNNDISFVEFNVEMPNLKVLILKSNQLREVPEFCHKRQPIFPKLKVLDLSDNLIPVVYSKNFQTKCLPSLQKLSLGYNKLKTVPKNLIRGLPRLEYLSIESRDPDVTFNEYSFNSSSLTYLYMANRISIRTWSGNFFQHSPNLKILDMTGIQLNSSTHPERKIFLLFRPLKKLEKLILTKTSLSTFPKSLFSLMSNLTELDLQHCYFNQLHLQLFASVSLRTLLLDNNLITTLNKTNLPSLVENIGLRGNPFLCTCDLIWFRRWIQTNSSKLLGWPNDYTCNLPQEWIGKNLADFQLSYSFCHPLNPYIVVAISTSFAVLVIVIVSFVLYQKRWHIKYYLYLLRAKRRGFEILGGDEYAYDVFVAYNSEDRVWVISELIPKLEKEEKLKLCLHDRDFQVGKLIVDNITDTMHRSRKVLIILSNSFAQSHWCLFETMLAQVRSINNGKETVIVVILENILSKHMTNSLHVLLKTITFIEWTNEKSGKEMFWNRLVAAIRT